MLGCIHVCLKNNQAALKRYILFKVCNALSMLTEITQKLCLWLNFQKKVKSQGQGHKVKIFLVQKERSCHKEHTCNVKA